MSEDKLSMSVCAIVLSYKRPQNIQRIVEQLCAVGAISKVIVSNNNPDVKLNHWLDVRELPVDVIEQVFPSICAKRFEIAATEPFDAFFCPDDDLFLTSAQIGGLIGTLEREPARVHGVFGEIHSFKDGKLRFGGGIHGIECEVDILNRCYLFTREHVRRMNELAVALDYKHLGEALYIDDVLLSFCGSGRPICHDFGPLDECPSSDELGIATYLERGFDEVRVAAYSRLAQMTAVSRQRR